MKEIIAEARGLTKDYGKTRALRDVNLRLRRGEILGLVGDNGSGKSTFLKLLAGQIFPTKGEVSLFGVHGEKELERQRKRTGTMIEAPGFFPQLTVEGNLEYYRIQKGIPGKSQVREILKRIGLYERRKTYGKQLSLGMKQRLGLGIALIGEPELLMLDEPINGLDPSGIIEMRELLIRLCRERNITIILSSHILAEMEQLADEYCFLDKGRLLKQITAEQLEEECGGYIEIQVDEPELYTVLLERRVPGQSWKVLPGQKIRISGSGREPEFYSRLAAENGILFLNIGLYVSDGAIREFQYANVKFSLSFLTGDMLFLPVAGAVLSVLLFSAERRNGVMKNAVAYGISRKSLFFGKCVVSFLAALGSMVLLISVYVISAVILLEGPVQPYLGLMLQGVAVNLPFAAAGVILAAGLTQFFERELVAGIVWMGVMFLIPAVFYTAGFEIPALAKIASWMPRNYLMTDVMAGMSGYLCLWSEFAGAVKCVVAGVTGIAVFTAVGVFLNRRKEI